MRLQQQAAFRQRQSSEIAVLADQKIEDEIVYVLCFAAKVLEQVEARFS